VSTNEQTSIDAHRPRLDQEGSIADARRPLTDIRRLRFDCNGSEGPMSPYLHFATGTGLCAVAVIQSYVTFFTRR
jgi:hypothetical protein